MYAVTNSSVAQAVMHEITYDLDEGVVLTVT